MRRPKVLNYLTFFLTPDETKKSIANFEFQRPCPVGPLKNEVRALYNECRSIKNRRSHKGPRARWS